VSEIPTVDKHAALFESCDIFIETDDDGWVLILADSKARAVVNSLIDGKINWDFGTPVQQWWTTVPPNWRAVDLDFRKMDHDKPSHIRRTTAPRPAARHSAPQDPFSLTSGQT
jgi:hypothetical protein